MKERTEEKGDGCLFWIIGALILMAIINGNEEKINKLEARIETLEKMHLEDGHK